METRKALITGASRGIGEAIAKRLAQEGWALHLTGRDQAKLETVRAACEALGAEVSTFPADLSNENEVIELFRQAGPVELLVNNAGIGIFGEIVGFSLEEFRKIQSTNVEGSFLCLREAMKSMMESGGGRIINISSVVGVKGYPNQAAYGASKHALLGLTKTAIEEGRAHNIRVHAICPGGVATEMVKQSRPDLTDFSAMIQPEDVAEAVAYLCRLPENITVDCIHLRRAASAQCW
ncbi:SDR family NAD(P)-dependent oxidoreductase [Pontiella sp.]|uniref:SDR family NAD(P)-dependent oxidoreductase n=1 Tax=Pontiella sp. TaxID=2837462 RepID=UPI003569E048